MYRLTQKKAESSVSRLVPCLLAISFLFVSSVAIAQDKDELRRYAKEAKAQLLAQGEPRDRCTLGVLIGQGGVVTRLHGKTPLLPGDVVMTIGQTDVSGDDLARIQQTLRVTPATAVLQVGVVRDGRLQEISVPCMNAREKLQVMVDAFDLAGRGKFTECADMLHGKGDLGTDLALLLAQCAALSREVSEGDRVDYLYSAMRMMVEDAHWVRESRKDVIQRLNYVEGQFSSGTGPARFQDLVALTRKWPGGEGLYDASVPDWAVFRRNAETALRQRLIDPDSARVEWNYGFLYGFWKPFLSQSIQGYWTCGRVNARNRMGGYTGRSAFVVVLDRDGSVLHIDIGSANAHDTLATACANSAKLLPPAPPALSIGADSKTSSVPSIADEIAKLVELREKGSITESEFEVAKQRLLGSPTGTGRD